jgi:CO/xanthine dehydrogenase Mo-binding subunit
MNALRNATGAIITKLPALPDRILEAIEIGKNGSK